MGIVRSSLKEDRAEAIGRIEEGEWHLENQSDNSSGASFYSPGFNYGAANREQGRELPGDNGLRPIQSFCEAASLRATMRKGQC
jgi:hypothetical protein